MYQATSQLTDESGQTFPFTVDTLLDRALGPEGYYGAFVANMHTDFNPSAGSVGSDAIVFSAQARGVPVVSAKQMLDWVDGRNGSTFDAISWNGRTLTFSVSAATGANGLQSMLPTSFAGQPLVGITRDGTPAAYSYQTIKGVSYALFDSTSGSYQAHYEADVAAPVISSVVATPGITSASFTWNTNEAATSRVDYGTGPGALGLVATASGLSTAHTVTLTGLSANTAYYYRVTSVDASGHSTTDPPASSGPASFLTNPQPVLNCPCTIWSPTAVPELLSASDTSPYELGVKFRAAYDGYITGIRFYKGPSNTGVHVGSLWTTNGSLLARATFTSESDSGWQQVTLASPVLVKANTTYVVSYHTSTGGYSANLDYFENSGVVNGPLQALSSGASGGNGVFTPGNVIAFPTSTFRSANYWVDVVFDIDITSPLITGVTPAAGASDVSLTTPATATFSEDINAASVSTSTFELRDPTNTLVPAAVTYASATRTATLQPTAGLTASTTYTVRVLGGASGIKDSAGNALSGDVSWSFTTGGPPPFTVTDTTAADFGAGAPDAGVYLSETGNGEVILAPQVAAEFSGTTLPAGWSSTAWATGATTTVAGGQLTVDGARAGLDALLPPGQRLEFVATFSPTAGFQHMGFGLTFNEAPWIIFSTSAGGSLYARTNDGTTSVNTLIPGNWLGSPRRYRIDWTASSVTFWIDGTQVATRAFAISTSLRPIVSDFTVGDPTLPVDWIRMSPYATSGVFTSRVLDGGSSQSWAHVSWNAVVPATTTLAMAVRFGDTPAPDASWTAFAGVPNSGAAVSVASRYVQYQANLSGTGTDTPELSDVTIAAGTPNVSPTISVNDVAVVEPSSGLSNATFIVTLSKSDATTITVSYATAGGTATADTDFTSTSGTLTFAPGLTSLTINVPVIGDSETEAAEGFQLNLSSTVNATLAKALGVGTIFDSSATPPSLSVADVSAAEGNSGVTNVMFTVTLSAPSTQMITVGYLTGGGTATSGSDYSVASGSLTFQPGETQQAVFVSIFGDALSEADETFFMTLGSPTNAIISRGQATASILNDDAPPALSIGDVSVVEGNSGTSNVQIPVTLSAPSGQTVTVAYSTAPGTASAGSDFTTTSGTLTLAAGSTSQSISVPIVGDVLNEPDDTFTVSLSNPIGATIALGLASVTITDDDKPQVSVSSVSVTEGNAAKNVVVTATLSAASTQQVTVSYATANGTALDGSDYAAQTGPPCANNL